MVIVMHTIFNIVITILITYTMGTMLTILTMVTM